MSDTTRTVLDIVKGSFFLLFITVFIPLLLLGHVSAVVSGRPSLLA